MTDAISHLHIDDDDDMIHWTKAIFLGGAVADVDASNGARIHRMAARLLFAVFEQPTVFPSNPALDTFNHNRCTNARSALLGASAQGRLTARFSLMSKINENRLIRIIIQKRLSPFLAYSNLTNCN